MNEKLYITHDANQKLRQYTDLCPEEISGIGRVVIEDGKMTVVDVHIFKQSVSGAHSTIDPTALADFQTEIVKAGGSMKEYVLWWHSHANMSVFFSTTDTDTIASSTEFPYLISLVVNKKGESRARLDVYYPQNIHADLDLEVEEAPLSKEAEDLIAEINELEDKLEEIVTKESDNIKLICQAEIDEKVSTNRFHFGTDKDYRKTLKTEYWEEKIRLMNRIKYFEKTQGMDSFLQSARDQLAEHVEYGITMEYEEKRNLITKGK